MPTTLELAKEAHEHRAEQLGGDGVQDFAHVRVARNPRNAVDGVQIASARSLSKARSEGALRENMAKADMRTSDSAISTSAGR